MPFGTEEAKVWGSLLYGTTLRVHVSHSLDSLTGVAIWRLMLGTTGFGRSISLLTTWTLRIMQPVSSCQGVSVKHIRRFGKLSEVSPKP